MDGWWRTWLPGLKRKAYRGERKEGYELRAWGTGQREESVRCKGGQ